VTVRDWSELPLTLHMRHIAAIYALHEKTVRSKVEKADPSIPRPAFLRPYRWRKSDVRKHYEEWSVAQHRRAIAKSAPRACSL
jgi:hypothetical protein